MFSIPSLVAQSKLNTFLKPSDSLNTSRKKAVIITEAALGTTALVGLNQLWYADYERSNFHTLNDNGEWLQMDKLGHVFSSYQLGKIGADVLQWSGTNQDSQLIYGATLGFTFLTAVEVFDGFSQEWGFSWGDMAANATGTGLYIGQELLWNEQRMTLKYSFHQTKYASQRPDKLGAGILEEALKDYNGQTYWLSVNVHSFFKTSKIPKWANIAFGYGADGMLSGHDNYIEELGISHDRKRQFYLSLDVDLTKIETNSHVLKTLFSLFNMIKIPFPTLELSDKGNVKFHKMYL